MTIKKTAITLLCLGALGGTAYGAIEAPTASAHMHYPMLRLCHKQSFKTITNKHIGIKVPKVFSGRFIKANYFRYDDAIT